MKQVIIAFASLFFVISTLAQGPRIEFEAPGLYPEGVAYDPKTDVFYVSSARTGVVGKVSRNGNYTALLADSTLKSTFGMKLSPDGKKLWVCAGDPNYSKFRDSTTYRKMIRLVGIDVNSGKKATDIDLSTLFQGKHFANDLTLDDKGNIYITDSYSPVIYRVDPNGTATIFAQNMLFSSPGVGLNGIVWHPGNYLIAVNNGNGSVLKVDIAKGGAVSVVKINQFFPGADGLWLDGKDNLLLVQNKGVNRVFKLTSSDNWQQASVVAATAAKEMFSYPSTVAKAGTEYWVVNAKLNELSDSLTVLSKKFSLQQARLNPVK